MLGVKLCGLVGMMLCMLKMASRYMRVVGGRLMLSGLVMMGRFFMMLGGLLVMLGGLSVVFCTGVVSHILFSFPMKTGLRHHSRRKFPWYD